MIRNKISSKFTAIILALLLGLTSTTASFGQQSLENTNQSLRYSRYSRLSPKIIPIQSSERNFILQIPIEKLEDDARFDDYEFYYTILNSYQQTFTQENLTRLQESDLKKDTPSHFYFEERIVIPEEQSEAIALVKIVDSRQGDEYYYHMDLVGPFILGHPNFGAYFGNSIPFDQTFLTKEQALLFQGTAMNLHRFHYPAAFGAPFPPMETKPAPVPREVKVEYQGDFLINTPRSFDDDGYYFIQSDTNSTAGLMIKTAPEAFPRVNTWEDMIDMVVYISTRKEHEQLLEATDKKKALDQYWIGITKDEEAAKTLIREYFRQIEFANILFTDFKEGWKTDRGMVYTVMGPPNGVVFRQNAEIWTYGDLNSNSKINFTFARVKNILTPNYYTLNRSRALQPEWFQSITLWRSGRMDF
ncbi:GWxTD domain-containing protein [Belliella kenyensis]|uniref:GWxTD domain-containing protein n=1 Tax=Belliella kenyensis TaxID=1472724 RepID=A0ABV8EJN2_9BACT|nr:GWxTD domain-containing protein [Belliella kenyensis]MCH7402435.1 GWxTD domain-containing protein [Belliella kenyensis]MDN3603626.1 GWxTD domain-containing protein [Belliella kenyensis]